MLKFAADSLAPPRSAGLLEVCVEVVAFYSPRSADLLEVGGGGVLLRTAELFEFCVAS
jgi:hypothetical protein